MRAASSTIPSVARIESRNPTLAAIAGSSSSRMVVARQRKVKERPRRPPVKAANPTAPMTAARKTLGSGPTIMTKAKRPHAAKIPAAGRGSRKHRANKMKPPRIREQLAPETAVRCVIPVVFMAVSRLSGKALVSPVTIPGSKPAASGGSQSAAETNRFLTSAAVCLASNPESVTTGAEDALRSAASGCPSRTCFSVPVVLTLCPARTFCQAAPPVTTMSAVPRTTLPLDVRSIRLASTVHLPSLECPGAGAGAGLPVMSMWTRTPSSAAIAGASGPFSRLSAMTAQ